MWHSWEPGCLLNISRLRSHRFLMFFEGEDSEIDLQQPEPEFSEYKWVDIKGIPLDVCSNPSLTPLPQSLTMHSHQQTWPLLPLYPLGGVIGRSPSESQSAWQQ